MQVVLRQTEPGCDILAFHFSLGFTHQLFIPSLRRNDKHLNAIWHQAFANSNDLKVPLENRVVFLGPALRRSTKSSQLREPS